MGSVLRELAFSRNLGPFLSLLLSRCKNDEEEMQLLRSSIQPPHRSKQQPTERPHFWSPPPSIACGANAPFVSITGCVVSFRGCCAATVAPILACHKGGGERIEEGKKIRIGILGAWEGGGRREERNDDVKNCGEWKESMAETRDDVTLVQRARCTEKKG